MLTGSTRAYFSIFYFDYYSPLKLFRLDEIDEFKSKKFLSDESISAATNLLSTTPANGIMNSSKNSTSSVRQRVVHFKPGEGECQHSHSHSHSHSHVHHHHEHS